MKNLIYTLLILSSVMALPAHSLTLEPIWSVDGFKQPESVVYDKKRQRYYVSNINDGVAEQDGNGSIGFISEDGQETVVDWVDGLSSPKGLALRGNYLFTADIKELVVINVEKAQIVARYPAPDSVFFNDITISPDGEVFVSDMLTNKIYRLGQHEIKIWYESDSLDSPNGLFATKKHLYIGTWGAGIQADFSTETSGSLKRLSYKSQSLETVSDSEHWMNLDGVEMLRGGKGWLATSFLSGELLHFSRKGELLDVVTLVPSVADLHIRYDQCTLVIPNLETGEITAYKVTF